MTLHETLSAEISFNRFILERNIDTQTSLRHQHHCDDILKRFSDLYSTPFTTLSLSAYDITVGCNIFLSDHYDVNGEG